MGAEQKPGAQAAALLYCLRLDLSRWRHERWTEAYNARRRASTMVEVGVSKTG